MTGRPSRATVRKTNRVIVAYEDMRSWGYGAEIAARIADELFDELDAPVRRVAATDTFCRLPAEARRRDPAPNRRHRSCHPRPDDLLAQPSGGQTHETFASLHSYS